MAIIPVRFNSPSAFVATVLLLHKEEGGRFGLERMSAKMRSRVRPFRHLKENDGKAPFQGKGGRFQPAMRLYHPELNPPEPT
jgi:hypothetical protein